MHVFVHKHPFASNPFDCKCLSNARVATIGDDGDEGGVDNSGLIDDGFGAPRDDVATDTSQNSARVMTSAPALPRRNVVILVVVVAGGVSRCVAGVQHPCSRVAAPILIFLEIFRSSSSSLINIGCETALSRSVIPHS
jgi:hypothetical protein